MERIKRKNGRKEGTMNKKNGSKEWEKQAGKNGRKEGKNGRKGGWKEWKKRWMEKMKVRMEGTNRRTEGRKDG